MKFCCHCGFETKNLGELIDHSAEHRIMEVRAEMSWRPEGWVNKHRDVAKTLEQHKVSSDTVQIAHLEADLFEAGADAMLEALKKGAQYTGYEKEVVSVNIPTSGLLKGWIIYIPDEKEVNHGD